MFDPITISHDDCVSRIIKITKTITSGQASKAFLSSLSAHRFDWRSGIASYSIAKLLSAHKYAPIESGDFYQDGAERMAITQILLRRISESI